MPPLKAVFAKLLPLARAVRPSPAVRTLIALWLFWICFIHVVPLLSGALLRGTRPGASQWTQQMAAVQTPLSRWDARWYFTIASDGYSFAGTTNESTVRFYPLYPMLMAATKWATGIGLLWAGTVVSALALLGTLVLLVGRARAETGDEAGLSTVEAILFFPSAFVLASVYSESISLLAILLSTILARRGRWLAAGLVGALAGMSRVNGCLVLLPLLVLALAAWRENRRWRPCIALVLATLGAAVFPLYLWWKFGDPLLYFHTRPANWTQHPRFFPLYLWDLGKAIVSFIQMGNVPKGVQGMTSHMFPVNLGVLVLMFWALGASVRKRKWDDTAFMAGACLFSISVGNLDSLARHALIYFPIFLRLGETAAAHRTFRLALSLVFLCTQAVLLTLFVHWVFVL